MFKLVCKCKLEARVNVQVLMFRINVVVAPIRHYSGSAKSGRLRGPTLRRSIEQ